MTHEEYVSKLESLGDSPADVDAVLSHVAACAACDKEQRFADRKIGGAAKSRSVVEPLLRWGAVASILGVIVLGLRHSNETNPKAQVRYRIVGNASGVVAYTPGGIVTGTIRIRTSESRRQR
ncbi:MAG TPA: hypothetical protein VJA66_11450 [Thermoanaerobaculia bacterium]